MSSLAAPVRDRGITTLTLDAPARRNALSAELVGELSGALDACAADTAVRAVVLTHTGTTFCAGADLTSPADPQEFVALLRKIVALPKPVVGRVTGHVRRMGSGCSARATSRPRAPGRASRSPNRGSGSPPP